MYGFERVEGSIAERAAEYAEADGMNGSPFILAGWSLAACWPTPAPSGSGKAGADVEFVGLIDTVRAGEEIRRPKRRSARAGTATLFASGPSTSDPAIPTSSGPRRRRPGRFVLDAVKQSGSQYPGWRDRAPAHLVPRQPRHRHRQDRALRRARDAVHGRPVPRRRDHVRAALRNPQAGRRWGEFVSDLEVVPIGASTSRPSTSRTLPRWARI